MSITAFVLGINEIAGLRFPANGRRNPTPARPIAALNPWC
ncbi:hypothetical protein BF49_3191 [Bradyrhizobium sp.]|nr:hypothetical protein BF49_3191 [Bradyrhizobium sp.]